MLTPTTWTIVTPTAGNPDDEWLESLRGPPGPPGKSAKEVVIDADYLPEGATDADFAEWLLSGAGTTPPVSYGALDFSTPANSAFLGVI